MTDRHRGYRTRCPAWPAPAELLRRLRARTSPTRSPTSSGCRPAPAAPRRGRPGCRPSCGPRSPRRGGITAPWQHQAEAAVAGARRARTWCSPPAPRPASRWPTSCRRWPRLLADPRATALYLAPTKALAADQLRAVAALGSRRGTAGHVRRRHPARGAGVDPAALPVRADQPGHAAPRASCPGTPSGARFLRRLAYVVVDECHTYRGVFGSHVAHVLRRLRRLRRPVRRRRRCSCWPRRPPATRPRAAPAG